ncbi:nickel-binding protein [Seohaeicola saemankumensis]|uniref:Nickel-binding protein n=1 Tax=Seohaeicola saemankumensis TaxID=481181 RepID=A0ABW3TBW2_9RHOB
MNLYMIRRPSAWADQADLEKTAAISARIGDEEMPDQVRWIRSYVLSEPDGRLGTCCIYEAVNEDALREHARCVGMPGEDITPIGATVVIRPDPG